MNRKIILLIITLSFLVALFGCEKKAIEITYKSVPKYLDEKLLIDDDKKLSPIAIQKFRDSLYVIYNDQPRIDIYNLSLDFIRSIHLVNPEKVYPTKFQIFDSTIIVSEHFRNRFLLYKLNGDLIISFDKHSDEETLISPFGITYYGGVAYIGDLHSKKILAVSIVNATAITEIGELILKIPSDTNLFVEFTSEILVTLDGRLIVGDANDGMIKVFTCDGQYIYNFDIIPNLNNLVPMGFAYDTYRDPDLISLDTNSFDPSGVRTHGRLHVVDAQNNKIHMFNPYGKYLNSYPEKELFGKPTDIAIDWSNQVIYITDSDESKIIRFKYDIQIYDH